MTDVVKLVSTAGIGFAASVLLGVSPAGAAQENGGPTFAKDVAPIFHARCVGCHRPDHVAPMSLVTYDEARPWARAVKQRVEAREMPPWGAAPGVQDYRNDTSLTQEEIDTIVAWVDGGAPEGNAADLPAVPQFADGWSIGEPDYVFTMVEPHEVPADGTIPYLYFTVPTNLTEDVWISAHEVKPGDRRVLHHVTSQVIEGSGTPTDPGPKRARDRTRTTVRGAHVGWYVPNHPGTIYRDGVGSRLPAGVEIEAEMHYTTVGIASTDQTSWGVILAKSSPSELRQVRSGMVGGDLSFVIPPHEPNYEMVGRQTFQRDAYLLTLNPHMHSRGKDMTFTAVHSDGSRVVLLSVPRYNFNWQINFELTKPYFMPKGSVLEVVSHHDNSANNRANPNPDTEVRYGDQTWEEMAFGFYSTLDVLPDVTTQEQ